MSNDIRVTYNLRHGGSMTVRGRPWQTARDLAIENLVPGIIGSCGGGASCATCHVYVDASWESVLGARGEVEELALDFAYDVRDNSRLSCQITLRPEHDGMVLTVAENQ